MEEDKRPFEPVAHWRVRFDSAVASFIYVCLGYFFVVKHVADYSMISGLSILLPTITLGIALVKLYSLNSLWWHWACHPWNTSEHFSVKRYEKAKKLDEAEIRQSAFEKEREVDRWYELRKLTHGDVPPGYGTRADVAKVDIGNASAESDGDRITERSTTHREESGKELKKGGDDENFKK